MMRRLSKENTKQYGRYLGKITHGVPSVVFDTILEQIQAYDNLIVPVVDMMKYLTPMSFDVLSYIVLSHLASPTKERLKDDGLNVSLWMQSLSSFCGNLYKKYPSIELVGLLQYGNLAEDLLPWITSPTAGRAWGLLRQRNQFGTLISLALVATLWLYATRDSRRMRAGLVAAAVMLIAATAASGSRTGALRKSFSMKADGTITRPSSCVTLSHGSTLIVAL